MLFSFLNISVPNFLVVTSGSGDSGYLSSTETIDVAGRNFEPPYYPDHPRRFDGATGIFLHGQPLKIYRVSHREV